MHVPKKRLIDAEGNQSDVGICFTIVLTYIDVASIQNPKKFKEDTNGTELLCFSAQKSVLSLDLAFK